MKNLSVAFKRLAIVIVLLIGANSLKSQSGICSCPITITNTLGCTVTLNWEIVDANCKFVCGGSAVSLMNNGVITITAPCCAANINYDLYVTVTSPFNDGVHGMNTCGNPPVLNTSGNVDITQCSTQSTYHMQWNCNNVDIGQ